jgi:hypothetical protein
VSKQITGSGGHCLGRIGNRYLDDTQPPIDAFQTRIALLMRADGCSQRIGTPTLPVCHRTCLGLIQRELSIFAE